MSAVAVAVEVPDPLVPCPACDGVGVVENDHDAGPLWAQCVVCEGDSFVEAASLEPDVHDETRPVDLDECSRCTGEGTSVEYVDGVSGYRVCGWCLGTGMRGVA